MKNFTLENRESLESEIKKAENLSYQFYLLLEELNRFDYDERLSFQDLNKLFLYSSEAYAGQNFVSNTKDAYLELVCIKTENKKFIVSDLVEFCERRETEIEDEASDLKEILDELLKPWKDKAKKEAEAKKDYLAFQLSQDLENKEEDLKTIKNEIFDRKILNGSDDFAQYSNQYLKNLVKDAEKQIQDLKRNLADIEKEIKDIKNQLL